MPEEFDFSELRKYLQGQMDMGEEDLLLDEPWTLTRKKSAVPSGTPRPANPMPQMQRPANPAPFPQHSAPAQPAPAPRPAPALRVHRAVPACRLSPRAPAPGRPAPARALSPLPRPAARRRSPAEERRAAAPAKKSYVSYKPPQRKWRGHFPRPVIPQIKRKCRRNGGIFRKIKDWLSAGPCRRGYLPPSARGSPWR